MGQLGSTRAIPVCLGLPGIRGAEGGHVRSLWLRDPRRLPAALCTHRTGPCHSAPRWGMRSQPDPHAGLHTQVGLRLETSLGQKTCAFDHGPMWSAASGPHPGPFTRTTLRTHCGGTPSGCAHSRHTPGTWTWGRPRSGHALRQRTRGTRSKRARSRHSKVADVGRSPPVRARSRARVPCACPEEGVPKRRKRKDYGLPHDLLYLASRSHELRRRYGESRHRHCRPRRCHRLCRAIPSASRLVLSPARASWHMHVTSQSIAESRLVPDMVPMSAISVRGVACCQL